MHASLLSCGAPAVVGCGDGIGVHAPPCRPEGVTSAREGVALRTLVYHEVLTAYLAYVKLRGYTSMFIWACPPLQARGRGLHALILPAPYQ